MVTCAVLPRASPAALVHRARLRQVRSIVRGLQLRGGGRVVDLGCSDGFVVTQLRRSQVLPERMAEYSGFDRNQRLVAQAASGASRAPASPGSTSTIRRPGSRSPGELVICLETLEHVGTARRLEVIHHAIAPGGRLVLSMPNEVGVIGLGKFLGRPLLRRRPYQGFFPIAGPSCATCSTSAPGATSSGTAGPLGRDGRRTWASTTAPSAGTSRSSTWTPAGGPSAGPRSALRGEPLPGRPGAAVPT